jgi:SNF2 family DNA or RNA helicase
VASFEIPDNYEDLKTWVEKREQALEEEMAEGRQLKDTSTEILKQEQELAAQINSLTRKRRELDRKRDELRIKVKRELEVNELAKAKLKTFVSEKQLQEELEEKRKKFEELTLNLPWREFAFTHQIDGASRLATAGRSILGDKRGLGKTLTSIIALDMLQARKVLVVAPKDVLNNFGREIKHWAPHRSFVVISGMNKGQRNAFLELCSTPAIEDMLILINYEAWRRDPTLVVKLAHIGFDTVICDEAHKMKNSDTENFRGVKQIVYEENRCNLCGAKPERVINPVTSKHYIRCSVCFNEPEKFGDFCSVKNVIPMTGTAILNRPDDLWPLLNLVDRENFGSKGMFLRQYCETGMDGKWRFKRGGDKRLTSQLGMKYIARDEKTAGVKMPPQEITHHYVQWDSEAKAMYPKQATVMEQIRKYGAIKMSDEVALSIVGILAELTRQRQAVVWPAGIKVKDPETGIVLFEADAHESIKLDKAMEIIKLATEEEEDRVVVFSKFKEALKETERRLTEAGISCVRYDGDTKSETRDEIQIDFDAKTYMESPDRKPKWQVVLCNYDTGGVGLNLNAARQTVLLDREWNPGKEDQAQGRTQRLNTAHDTIVHVIHIEGTIDNFMDNLIDYKTEVINGFENENSALEKIRQALISGDFSV